MITRPASLTLLLLVGACAAQAAPTPTDREAALAAVAAGDLGEGVDHLRRATRGAEVDPELLCLLARVEVLAGRHADAARTFGRVPKDAACARQAAFGEADALAAAGRVDEAAARYAEHGASSLGPARDAALVAWLEDLSKRALEEDRAPMAAALDGLALEAELPLDARVALAGRVADRLLARADADEDFALPTPSGLVAALLAQLGVDDSASARRRVARFLSPREALTLLAPLPADAGVRALAARRAAEVDAEWGLRLLDRAAAEGEGTPAGRKARTEAVLTRARLGRLAAVEAPLRALAAGADEAAREASNLYLALVARGGDRAALVTALTDHLRRFPSDPRRTENEGRLDVARLELARAAHARGAYAEAIAHHDALVARDPRSAAAPRAAWEAALAARAAGRPEEALRRWEELRARWPQDAAAGEALAAMARARAFDAGDVTGALAWLAEQAEAGPQAGAASEEKARLEAPAIRVRTTRQRPGRDARVEVVARNLEWVEARLHRVDAEAYLRAGGVPSGLPGLDVAVIAPDRRFKVKVPRYAPHRDVAFDLAVPAPAPGLYVVTVASDDREASAVLWVSDLRVVARAVGPDLAVAAFRGDRPAPDATVHVRLPDGRIVTGRTDRTGLYRARLEAIGPLVVLAEADGAPALVRVDRGRGELPEAALKLAADLDRPAYRPGDALGFRVVARREGAPVKGRFTVWLAEGSTRYAERAITATELGTVHGALPVPPAAPGGGAWRRALGLWVQAPGEDAGQQVATVMVAPEAPPRRRMEAWIEGTDAVFAVRDAAGAPVVGARLTWEAEDGRSGDGRTDGAGRVRVTGPPAGPAWGARATLAGAGLVAATHRPTPESAALRLHVDDAAEGGTVRAVLHGPPGAYRLVWAPLAHADAPPEAPADPWVPAWEDGLEGADGVVDAVEPPTGVEGEAAQREVVLEGAHVEVALPTLSPGAWSLRAAPVEGGGASAQAAFRVARPAPGLRGLRDLRAGELMEVAVVGASPGLLTAGTDRLLAAAVAGPGAAQRWRTTAAWGGEVDVVLLTADGRGHARTVRVDPTLDVQIDATTEPATADRDAQWRLRARVTDGAGRPVRAEVALRVLDDALVEAVGAAASVDADGLRRTFPSAPGDGAFVRWVQTVTAEAVAAELLAEVARAAEKEKAKRAAAGRFRAEAMDRLLDAPPLEGDAFGFGGLGVVGAGRGGGGLGRGAGRARLRMGKTSIQARQWVEGERAAAAWAVLPTDADGTVELTVPVPRAARRWTLAAQAISADAAGAATRALSTREATRLSAPRPGPGSPGESVDLRVTVINGAAAPLVATLKAGDATHPVQAGPGEAVIVELGARAPGDAVPLRLIAGERVLDRLDWGFPLASGVPSPAGRVVTIAAAPGGGVPAAWLASRPDPDRFTDAGRAAAAGRAALAALAVAPEAQRPALRAQARAARAALRTLQPRDARADAERLLFLAEGRDLLGVPRGELEQVAESLRAPGADPGERVLLAHARAVAGQKVDASALARLSRIEELPPEVSSRLARLLLLEKRPAAEARARVKGDGPQAILARAALGEPVDAARRALAKTPPPLAGDPALADWLRAAAARPGDGKGRATVRVGGVVVGTLDRARGGVLRAVVAGDDATVDTDGLAALVWRGNPAPAGAAPARVMRLPRGLDGEPVVPGALRAGAEGDQAVFCGGPDAPCRLAVGDALVPPVALDALGWVPPAGLQPNATMSGPVLRAVARGRYLLGGLVDDEGAALRPLHVEVVEAPGTAGVGPFAALARAAQAMEAQGDPTPWLAPWPTDADWPAALLGQRAAVRFEHALATDAPAATLVDRFEALREANPRAALGSAQIARVAGAYRAAGRPARAVDVWRAGLGGAFLAEAGHVRKVEEVAGLLASLQGLRRVAQRYPALPAVEEALFHLPQRLDSMADGPLPDGVRRAGVTATDLRLMAAAWDRAYVALWPDSPRRGEAAFHLVRTLQTLDAHAEAARWAAALARQLPQSAVLDGLLYLEGLSRLRLREDERALALFRRVSSEDFPQPDGSAAPAGSRDDARYALARLYEAKGDLDAARAAYEAAASTHEEAAAAAAALKAVTLKAEPFVQVADDAPLKLPVTLANVDTVHLRAYRLDLRTVFLRDGGLERVLAVNVSGVSPTWSGAVRVDADPFPRARPLALPLEQRGAYLVQLDAGGVTAVALAVRSDLALNVADDGAALRVTVRVDGRRAAGVALRGVGSGEVEVATTDVRGVARLAGPKVLAYTEAGDVAFSPPLRVEVEPARPSRRRPARPRKQKSNVEQRLEEQMQRNQNLYEQRFQFGNDAGIEAELL